MCHSCFADVVKSNVTNLLKLGLFGALDGTRKKNRPRENYFNSTGEKRPEKLPRLSGKSIYSIDAN